jgi:hypothetical protein
MTNFGMLWIGPQGPLGSDLSFVNSTLALSVELLAELLLHSFTNGNITI